MARRWIPAKQVVENRKLYYSPLRLHNPGHGHRLQRTLCVQGRGELLIAVHAHRRRMNGSDRR